MNTEFVQMEKQRRNGQEREAPLYRIDGVAIRMKVKATCHSSDRQTGLFVWAEPEDKEDSSIYPLATWNSHGPELDFDFTAPLVEWRDSLGLQSVIFSQISELPEEEQKRHKHPLVSICMKDVSGVGPSVEPFYLFSGLTHFSQLNKAGHIKGESYPAFPRLLEKLKRIDTTEPEPSILAFLMAASHIGKVRTVGLRFTTLT